MCELDLIGVTTQDGRLMLTAAASDWSRPISHCLGWDAANLVGHVGSILAWVARIAATGEPVAREDRETPPGDPAELSSWYSAQLDRTLEILAHADFERPMWTFSSRGERRVGWWHRRLAVGLAIHR